VEALGYLLVYAGWGTGVSLMIYGLVMNWQLRNPTYRRDGTRSDDQEGPELYRGGAWLAVMALAAVVFVTTGLPWIRGPGLEGHPIELNAWSGLDPLSAGFVVVGSFSLAIFARTSWTVERRPWLAQRHVAGVARRSARMVAMMAVSLLSVVGGNVLIQSALPTGSRVAWGAWLALASSVGASLLAMVEWLGPHGSNAPLRSAP
jgi:hypothetical protein